jgi:DNA polymerase III subunit beta
MKFSISKESLLAGLQQVQNIVSSKTTMPVLSNVLIQAVDGYLHFITSDLDMSIKVSMPADIESEGATTIPAKRFLSVVRELPVSEVSIEVDQKSNAMIRSGSSIFKLMGLSSVEYPELPAFDDGIEIKIDQGILRDALRATAYAVSLDETRYVLNGINFVLQNNVITLVATDGKRLAKVEREIEIPESHEKSFILPTKAVNELMKLCSDSGQMSIFMGEGLVSFDFDGKFLTSKLVDGNYPNYRQVIPGEAREVITMDRELLYRAINRVSLFASDKLGSVQLNFSEGQVEIVASSVDVGEARETLAARYSGPAMSVSYGPEYILAPLRNLSNDEVHLHLIDERSPGVLRVGTHFLYVIMPMRVQN